MAFIPTPNCVRVAMQGSVNANEQVVTLWFQGATPATGADLAGLAPLLKNWWLTEVLPIMSNGYALDTIYLVAQDSTTAPSFLYGTALPAVGAVNSPVVEPQTAPVVKFSTAARGRSGRGRNYVPGCPLNALASPGVINATFHAALVAAYTALSTYLSTTTYNHVVVQHFAGGVALSAGVPRFVTAYTIVSNSLGTQRRRRIGIGS